MPSIDDELLNLMRNCPILKEEQFNNKYPGVVNVVTFLDSTFRYHEKIGHQFMPYMRIGANDTKEFIDLLDKNNQRAVQLYQNIKNNLAF